MADKTITSANSVVTFTVAGLFPVPVQLSGYAADKAWDTPNIDMAETMIGVDGKKSAGYVFSIVAQNFSLQADSNARDIVTALINATRAAREVFRIDGRIELPSTGESYICTNGTLKNVKSIPDAAKVLQPVSFTIDWESVVATLI